MDLSAIGGGSAASNNFPLPYALIYICSSGSDEVTFALRKRIVVNGRNLQVVVIAGIRLPHPKLSLDN